MENKNLKSEEFSQVKKDHSNHDQVSDVDNLESDVVIDEQQAQSTNEFEQELNMNDDKIMQFEERYLRLQADFDNFRKRTQKERLTIVQRANKELVLSLLPIIDNLERALSNADNLESPLAKGVEMVYKQLLEELKKQGVKSIEALNLQFDPNYHQAIAKHQSDLGANLVLEEYQKGYLLHDEVLRPSMVVVSE
jgi:molecular chaperone GrpE